MKLGQQERPTTTLRYEVFATDSATKTSCSLNLRFWCPAVVYSVQVIKMAAEGQGGHGV